MDLRGVGNDSSMAMGYSKRRSALAEKVVIGSRSKMMRGVCSSLSEVLSILFIRGWVWRRVLVMGVVREWVVGVVDLVVVGF